MQAWDLYRLCAPNKAQQSGVMSGAAPVRLLHITQGADEGTPV